MRDLHREELLSAYLDGELNADERQLVERQLSAGGEFRQLFEHLQRQRELLRSLPVHRAPPDLAARVLQRIEASMPAAGVAAAAGREGSVVPASRGGDSGVHRNAAWRSVFLVLSALAAGLLIAFLVRYPDSGGLPRSGDVARQPVRGPVETADAVRPEDQLALAEFQRSVPFFLVLDLAISRKGQAERVFERSLQKAGIEINRTVLIENRLEADILDSRFLGDDKIAPVAGEDEPQNDSVEMYFLRSKAGQIDALQRELNVLHFDAAGLLKRRLDLAMGTKELEIFLRLNDAAEPPASGLARNAPWKRPAAFRLQFRMGLHSLSLPRFGAIASPFGPERLAPENRSSPAESEVRANRTSPAQLPIAGGRSGGDSERSGGSQGSNAVAGDPAAAPGGGERTRRQELQEESEIPAQVLIIVRNLK